MEETTLTLNKREIWLVEWIAKSECRQDLWDLDISEIMNLVMREWIKEQFDTYENLRHKAKMIRDTKEGHL